MAAAADAHHVSTTSTDSPCACTVGAALSARRNQRLCGMAGPPSPDAAWKGTFHRNPPCRSRAGKRSKAAARVRMPVSIPACAKNFGCSTRGALNKSSLACRGSWCTGRKRPWCATGARSAASARSASSAEPRSPATRFTRARFARRRSSSSASVSSCAAAIESSRFAESPRSKAFSRFSRRISASRPRDVISKSRSTSAGGGCGRERHSSAAGARSGGAWAHWRCWMASFSRRSRAISPSMAWRTCNAARATASMRSLGSSPVRNFLLRPI
mmetsp:Transcript_4815/g.17209  ORF Transcript_4815/g.17209 Transcript_4815/m.17209 type:complete len:272 (-) Transcript_4815:266-1081(-)